MFWCGSFIPWYRSETKENEMVIERQTLSERRKTLQQEHERLLDAQASLNQRDDHIFGRSQELAELEKRLESAKTTFEEERRAFEDKKSNLEIALASLAKREEVCLYTHKYLLFLVLLNTSTKSSRRQDSIISCFISLQKQAVFERESSLLKKELELLVAEEKIASKESVSLLVLSNKPSIYHSCF